ncbi:Mitochondrial zinc maintenance protein 1, mitochondrial [Psilocybe cubensis]|uniref:Mitochondrial zinc maintenance protein 1, mitochondrial n=1 Tax=Psilocybe cubensis TaxID=181762 RepID=A0ACB8HA27_PSICU|nr:Mitochondrial zinc maintenance protein 1, mitochondrial [Psilocybe cubensis]KAH9484039.1 Mitochondrial zinc maintenance protein 1, mitochondrial [Psilocybe cubensis]
MSIAPALKAATRSAYRDVLRAASVTFSGDQQVLQAFRLKIRNDISQNSATDPEAYQKHNQFIKDVAQVLRKNVVQGVHIKEPGEHDGGSLYRIRMTKDTELGDNDSIKNPPPIESSRSARRKEKGQPHKHLLDAVPTDTDLPSSSNSPPRYFSALKKAHKERVIPELLEEDLEEQFVRGSGPLDQLANPGLSKEAMKAAKQRERERQRRKKAKKKALQKNAQNSKDDAD